METQASIRIADAIWRETNGEISYDRLSRIAVRLINGVLTLPSVLEALITEAESRGTPLSRILAGRDG